MKDARQNGPLMLCFALTILVSAFLVFQVQPIISKCIIPWFGGSPAVWTTCLLFFQSVLFLGYAYAHLLTRFVPFSMQGLVHVALIMIAVNLLPIVPDPSWKPRDVYHPTWNVLCLLAANVGVPYFLLSTTGPLVQAWFARVTGGASPYRLYALSNFGSLAALVSYPFLVEPLLGSEAQGRLWTVGFATFAVACGYCAWRVWQRRDLKAIEHEAVAPAEPPSLGKRLGWLFYAALASVMLLAMTNHVCQDVAPVPFLWVLPLALYLVSLIICFEKERWYSPKWCGPATAVAIAIVSLLMAVNRMPYLWAEVTIYMGTLLLICILCHGQLVRRKPAPQFLTSFYLMTSAGGALGGIAVALIAPHIFSSYLELNFGLAICYLLALVAAFEGIQLRTSFGTRRWVAAASVAAFLGLLFVVRTQAAAMAVNMLAVTRDFYGVIAVDEFDRDNPVEHRRFMRHGRIMHGLQYLNPEREMKPTLYFTESSGIGRTIRTLEAEKPNLRVGIIGLGIGTLAAYGRTGDDYRYYEIDPEVLRLAKEFFTYIDKSPAHVECILGDARLSLERERPQKFDLLVVDAFSGDAIPAHLLTREALETYLRHLNQDGVLAIHISNRNVDLAPVVKGLAEGANLEARLVVTTDDEFKTSVSTAYWTLMSRNDKVLGSPLLREVAEPLTGRTLFWTDDFSNVFEILK